MTPTQLLVAVPLLGCSDSVPKAAVNEPLTGALVLRCGFAGIGFLLADRRPGQDPKA